MLLGNWKKKKKHEQNFPTHNLELAAVVFVFFYMEALLIWSACRIFKDHKSL